MRTTLYLVALSLALLQGCASAGLEFRPYLRSMPHSALLTRAVRVDRRDVPALAQAGAIVIGHISAYGAGFSGPAALEEAAEFEAARRGGTHLVVDSPRANDDRSRLQVELSFAVVRVTDMSALDKLAAHLRPHRGVHYEGDLPRTPDPLYAEPVAPELAPSDGGDPREVPREHARAGIRVVDGRHLKPLR